MRGIVLAGGTGARGSEVRHVGHPLAPVFDTPMVHHPVATLMTAGIRDILVISSPADHEAVRALLGDGARFGVHLTHLVQPTPRGIAHALLLGAEFAAGGPVALVLGDNLLHGPGVGPGLARHTTPAGAHVFAHRVHDPRNYGIIELDAAGRVLSVEEKPRRPRSDFAVPGLYFYPADVVDVVRDLFPARGRLGITAVNAAYLAAGRLTATVLGPETAWLDTGTPDALAAAGRYVRDVETRQGRKLACLEEIAWRHGWLSDADLAAAADRAGRSPHGAYLRLLAAEPGTGLRSAPAVVRLPADARQGTRPGRPLA